MLRRLRLDVWFPRIALAAIPFELFAVGYVLAPDAEGPPASAALRAGPVTIAPAPGWLPAADGRTLEHVDRGRVVVAVPAEPPGGPVTAAVEIGGATALAFGRPADRTYLFTLAGGGHVAIGCRDGGDDGCADVLAGASVTGAVEPWPTPETAAALATAVRELNRAVRGDRSAEQLAKAYDRFASSIGDRRLRPVREPAQDAAAALTRVAAAIEDGAAGRHARAAGDVRRAQQRLRAALLEAGAA